MHVLDVKENVIPALSEAEDAPSLAGLKIKDRYVLLEEIGRGLMARAYLAYDELLEGEVVVKVINTEIGGVEIPLGTDWVQEAKRAMKVRGCPYIASVTDFGEETCSVNEEEKLIPFIVWERVYGKTLLEYMDEGREIDERMMIATIIQLLQVLIALNKSNLIHGDLHVKNVMYDNVSSSRNFVKVIDFGLANLKSSEGDFKRDRKSVAKVISQVFEVYQEKQHDEDKQPFIIEVQKIAEEIAKPDAPTLEELNDILMRAEELERKFLLGVEWFYSRSKNKPVGLDPEEYIKTFKNDDDPAIVGATELDELESWLFNVLEEQMGRILALRGEIGLGKSRWCIELLHRLAHCESSVFIMRTKAYPGDKSRPFEPVRRLWRSFLGEGEEENYKNFLQDLFPEIPLLVEPLTDLLTPKVGEFNESTSALNDANYQKLVATSFKHLALKDPLVICIDDVSYADNQTLSMIRELANATARYPILIVLTYSTPGTGVFKDLIDELSRRDNYLLYELSELSITRTQELLLERYMWHRKEDAHKLTELLYPQVGGNPFYLFEMLKFLENRGCLRWEDNRISLNADIDLTENPPSVKSLMLERISNLPADMRDVVEWAAILGNEFSIDHLTVLSGLSTVAMEEMMKQLTAEHRIFIKADDRYAFNPYMLYDAVYSNIRKSDLKDRHYAAADVLQAKVHHDPKLNAKIAEHLLKSNQNAEVPSYYLKAARHAHKINLKAQAEEWCLAGMSALENAQIRDEQMLGKFHLLKGILARQNGDADGYRENTYNAYNCAILSRDKHLEGRALKALGEYYRSIADYRASLDYFQNGLQVLQEISDDREVALVLKEISINYCFMGDFDRAIEVLGQSREICEELNDREGMARIYNNLGLIYKIQGDLPTAKEWLERSIRLFREVDDIQGEVLPIGNMAIIYTEEGEFERAMILLREITSNDARLTDTRIRAKVHVTMGDVLFELGEYIESMEYYERALMVFRALGDRQGECETLTNMAFTCLEQKKNKLAENYSHLALQIKNEIGYGRGKPFNHLICARLARYNNDAETALENIKKGLESQEGNTTSWLALVFLMEKALVNTSLNNIDDAKECYDKIESIVSENPDKTPRTFQVQYYHHCGNFLNKHIRTDSGEEYLTKSQVILGSLERKIFQMKWREKFRKKYNSLLDISL